MNSTHDSPFPILPSLLLALPPLRLVLVLGIVPATGSPLLARAPGGDGDGDTQDVTLERRVTNSIARAGGAGPMARTVRMLHVKDEGLL